MRSVSPFASHWAFDPETDFLNHGSYGALPRVIAEERASLLARLDRQPVQFYGRDLDGLIDAARVAVAARIGADTEGLVFVPNASFAVNAVLASVPLESGDDVLTTSHVYGGCRHALEAAAERSGARVVEAHVPFPIRDAGQVVEALLAHATPRTRLVLVDHITSPTALVFPVREIVAAFEGRGIPVLVDGAHAPGMIDLDVRSLGASWYTGNLHKWLLTPRSVAALWAREDRRLTLRCPVVSHARGPGEATRPLLHARFDWMGTMDPTPALCAPRSIRFLDDLDAQHRAVTGDGLDARCRDLIRYARAVMCEALEIDPPSPDDMTAWMASFPLPSPLLTLDPPRSAYTSSLQDTLLGRYGIEAPVSSVNGRPVIRVSAHAYNDPAQYERLARALRELLGRA